MFNTRQYFKVKGEDICFEGVELEVYIPVELEDRKIFVNQGDFCTTFGVFNFKVKDAKGKYSSLQTTNMPNVINLYPSDIVVEKMALIDGEEPENVYVLKFYNGDVFTNKAIRKDSTNVENFLNMLVSGKLPPTTKYSKVLALMDMNLELNSVNMGVPSVIRECLIANIYRYKQNPSMRFGEAQGQNPKISDLDYRAANMREVASRSSTFSAITFEDMDAMITSSINMNNYNKKEQTSPVEKIIKM